MSCTQLPETTVWKYWRVSNTMSEKLGTVYTTPYCPIYNSMNETGATQSLSLTSLWVCSTVHSNVYDLGNNHCITYFTAVDSFLSTSPPLQTHYTLTSGSVEVPLDTTARNSSSIGEEPVPSGSWSNGIRRSATSSLVSYTDQGIITFTNVLQGHKAVVLVCYTSEWEPDTFTRKEEIPLQLRVWCFVLKLVTYLELIWKPYKNFKDEQDNIFNLSLDSTSVVQCSCLLFAKKNL